jgi:RNA-binding protein
MNIPHMTREKQATLREKAKALKPLVWVGKNGLTERVIQQTKNLLTKRKLVKIKLLSSFIEGHDKKQTAMELALRTDSALVELTGFMVVLYKR